MQGKQNLCAQVRVPCTPSSGRLKQIAHTHSFGFSCRSAALGLHPETWDRLLCTSFLSLFNLEADWFETCPSSQCWLETVFVWGATFIEPRAVVAKVYVASSPLWGPQFSFLNFLSYLELIPFVTPVSSPLSLSSPSLASSSRISLGLRRAICLAELPGTSTDFFSARMSVFQPSGPLLLLSTSPRLSYRKVLLEDGLSLAAPDFCTDYSTSWRVVP